MAIVPVEGDCLKSYSILGLHMPTDMYHMTVTYIAAPFPLPWEHHILHQHL